MAPLFAALLLSASLAGASQPPPEQPQPPSDDQLLAKAEVEGMLVVIADTSKSDFNRLAALRRAKEFLGRLAGPDKPKPAELLARVAGTGAETDEMRLLAVDGLVALASKDEPSRRKVCAALRGIVRSPPEALALRRAAAGALVEYIPESDPREAVGALLELASSRSASFAPLELRRAALAFLARLRVEDRGARSEALSNLSSLVFDSSEIPELRADALSAFPPFVDADNEASAADALVRVLRDRSSSREFVERIAAARSARGLGFSPASQLAVVDALLFALEPREPRPNGGKKPSEELRRRLEQEEELRSESARALGALKLDDPDALARAVAALHGLVGDRSESADSDKDRLRRAAAPGLARQGKDYNAELARAALSGRCEDHSETTSPELNADCCAALKRLQ